MSAFLFSAEFLSEVAAALDQAIAVNQEMGTGGDGEGCWDTAQADRDAAVLQSLLAALPEVGAAMALAEAMHHRFSLGVHEGCIEKENAAMIAYHGLRVARQAMEGSDV